MKSRVLLALALAVLLLGGLLVPRPAHACQPVYHVVKPGENLTQIALAYGVTVQSIVQANNLWNPNYIYAGQYLLIPVPCAPAPPTGCYLTHVVKRGEYLKVIAARYGVSVASIVNANGLKNPNLIYPGQRLKIPTACKPSPPPDSASKPWKGEYWNNRFLQGGPQLVRNEKAVNFNWGVASPGDGIFHDNFSARFTRNQKLTAGWYRFQVRVDDGVRLWVDGKLLIDRWQDTAPRDYWVDTYIATGNHSLRVDYYEHTGGALIRLTITAIGAPVQPTVTPTTPQPPTTNMWRGEYCSTRIWADCCCPAIRFDPDIFFDWGPDGPWPTFRKDDFAVRWTRDVYFDAGTYRFTADVDDGVVVLIDGNAIITQWYDTNGRVFHSDQQISAGTHHIEVQYYEALNDARIKFFWTKLY